MNKIYPWYRGPVMAIGAFFASVATVFLALAAVAGAIVLVPAAAALLPAAVLWVIALILISLGAFGSATWNSFLVIWAATAALMIIGKMIK